MEDEKLIPRILIADAGVLFSAIAYDGPESTVLDSKMFQFMIAPHVIEELVAALPEFGFGRQEIMRSVYHAGVDVIGGSPERSCMDEAWRLIGGRDPSDVSTVALALSTENDGIWSSDKDFDGLVGIIKVWSSRELLGRGAKKD
jgi:hypothetical protein